MNITPIEAKTIPEAHFLCLKALVDDGMGHPFERSRIYKIDRGSFAGQLRHELDYVVIHIEYPGTRPLVLDVPAGVPAPCTQEYIDNYLPYLMAGVKTPNEDYTYGIDICKQMPDIIAMYKNEGYNTNQAFMAVGSPDSIKLKDPQCLRMIDTRIERNKQGKFALNFIVYFRSWDLWAGLPGNLGGIQVLKEYMASEIGVEDGEIIASSKGLHLYEYSWPYARAIVKR